MARSLTVVLILVFFLPVLATCDINCDSCSSCASALASAAPGQTVCLVQDIQDQEGSCIYGPSVDENVTFDCLGHAINGDETSPGAPNSEWGIYLAGRKGVRIRNCQISGFDYGIQLRLCQGCTVQNTTVQNNQYIDIYLDQSLDAYESGTVSGNLLENVRVVRGRTGVYLALERGDRIVGLRAESVDSYGLGLFNSEDIEVRNSVIIDCQVNTPSQYDRGSVYLSGDSNVLFYNVLVDGGLTGIYLRSSSGVVIRESEIRNATGEYGGIWILLASENLIERSYIHDNLRAGVFISTDANKNTIRNSWIYSNGNYGISIFGGWENSVESSVIVNNSPLDVVLGLAPGNFFGSANPDEVCSTRFMDVNVSWNKPLVYLANGTYLLDGDINTEYSKLSEVILCNAGGSTVRNIHLCGAYCSGGIKNNGIYIYRSDNVTVEGINAENTFTGVYDMNSQGTAIVNAEVSQSGVGYMGLLGSPVISGSTMTGGDGGLVLMGTLATVNVTDANTYLCDNSIDVYLLSSGLSCVGCGSGNYLLLNTAYVDEYSSSSCDCNLPCPADGDGDGYTSSDCNDQDSSVNPGAGEDCSDGVDNDCDGLTDCQDPDCSGYTSCLPNISVVSASVSPVFLMGKTYSISLTLNSTKTIYGVPVAVLEDGNPDQTSERILEEGENTFFLLWTPESLGEHALSLYADYGNSVAESDESDNEYSTTVMVCRSVCEEDPDGDGNSEYWVDCNGDGNVDHYLDEDDNVFTETVSQDYDGDGYREYGADTDGDGVVDGYCDLDTLDFYGINLSGVVRAEVPALTRDCLAALLYAATLLFIYLRS